MRSGRSLGRSLARTHGRHARRHVYKHVESRFGSDGVMMDADRARTKRGQENGGGRSGESEQKFFSGTKT